MSKKWLHSRIGWKSEKRVRPLPPTLIRVRKAKVTQDDLKFIVNGVLYEQIVCKLSILTQTLSDSDVVEVM